MIVRLVARPRPPFLTSCDCCLKDDRRCVQFTAPVQPWLGCAATIDICRSCIREGLRIAMSKRGASR